MRSVSPWTAIRRPDCKVLATRCHAQRTITQARARCKQIAHDRGPKKAAKIRLKTTSTRCHKDVEAGRLSASAVLVAEPSRGSG